ncbi:MAG: hypothetical protein H6682_11650 [Candidatus Eisenbacteria bacterium]|nr:hypothetical protein [Candidatus Eisenbacteria bacterium]
MYDVQGHRACAIGVPKASTEVQSPQLTALASGVYFARLWEDGRSIATTRFVVVR